ncbi:MAG: hypothetical protein K0R09_1759 [Clostridiales bacterium]|nr:hypothetical protein [Clostridiales bacterium]
MSKIAKDISKCARIALYISIGAFIIFGVIYLLFYSNRDIGFFYYMKNNLYYVGCIGLVICCGFFIKKNANRSFKYQDDWNRMFHKLNLAFVIFFISLFICLYGMIIQLLLEVKIM